MKQSRKHILFIAGVVGVCFLAFLIRAYNVVTYTTWWADDGGAHIAYIEEIATEGRLPVSMANNYLAWHEPGYYAVMAVWRTIGTMFFSSDYALLNWQEALQASLGVGFVLLVYFFTLHYTKQKFVALSTALLSAILFPLVKLSAYLNNELMVQTAIMGLVFLFVWWQLAERQEKKYLVFWSILVGIALWIKLSAVIVLFAAIVLWCIKAAFDRQLFPLVYVVLSLCVVGVVYAPWLYYKQQQFGSAFSINIYEQEQKQALRDSDAWEYLKELNKSVILTHPYWETTPHSFASYFFADTFSDFYNLFTNTDAQAAFPDAIQTTSARYTSKELLRANLLMNRTGIVIALVWAVGLLGTAWQQIVSLIKKRGRWNDLFLFILITGGVAALIYNNLRHPFLERGVLKASFIVFIYPLIATLAYRWWWQVLSKKWLWALLVFGPLLVYLTVGWRVLFV